MAAELNQRTKPLSVNEAHNMALSHEDYKDVSRKMGKGTAKKVRKATYDADDWSKKNLGKPSNAKAKALGKRAKKNDGVDMTSFFKKKAKEGHNPFGMVTHINGKKR